MSAVAQALLMRPDWTGVPGFRNVLSTAGVDNLQRAGELGQQLKTRLTEASMGTLGATARQAMVTKEEARQFDANEKDSRRRTLLSSIASRGGGASRSDQRRALGADLIRQAGGGPSSAQRFAGQAQEIQNVLGIASDPYTAAATATAVNGMRALQGLPPIAAPTGFTSAQSAQQAAPPLVQSPQAQVTAPSQASTVDATSWLRFLR